MADKKISELSSLLASDIDSADLFHVVDVSEALDSNKNKKFTRGELDKYLGYNIASVSSNYTASIEDGLIVGDTSSAAFTVTLPSASGLSGKSLKVIKSNTDLNKLTVDGSGSETINGSASVFLLGQYESIELVSDGTNWLVLRWEQGADVVSVNSFTQENNIDINQLTYTFARECLIVKESNTTWSGSGGSAAILAWTLPGSLEIDTSRRGGGGTSIQNQEANVYGSSVWFTTGWFVAGLYYNSATTLKLAAGGGNLQYSNLTNGDSVRFMPYVEIPIA